MKKDIPLYQTIYHKVVDRILVGSYKKGDRLASEQQIHAKYNVGYTSIRRAMHMLQQDGFISSEERKRPVVLYDPDQPDSQKLLHSIFVQRCDAHLDCYNAMPHIIPGIACMGAGKSDKALLEGLDALSSAPLKQFATQSDLREHAHRYISLVIRQAGNELAEDMFYQCLGFDKLRRIVMPGASLLPGEAQNTLSFLRHLTSLIRQGNLDELHTLLFFFFRQSYFELARQYASVERVYSPDYPPLEFCWNVRQAPTPLYRRVAYDLLRTAQASGFVPGDYFPSEAALMKQYDVAGITIRNALALLASMGFAQAVNGVGTRFISEYCYSSQTNDYLQEYFEALEIFSACGRSLAYTLGGILSPGDIASLKEDAAAYRSRNGLLVRMLGKFIDKTPIHAQRDILDQLQSRMIFGLFINDPQHGSMQQAYLEQMYRQAVDCLEQLEKRNTDEFATRFSALFDATYQSSRARLADLQKAPLCR